jgi:hypothetical protein
MGGKLAQSRREAFLPGIVEMALITEEDHLVLASATSIAAIVPSGRSPASLTPPTARTADAAGERADFEIVGDEL